jgi:hypothetical protein
LSCCKDKVKEKPRTIVVKEKVIVKVGGKVWESESSTPTEDFYGDLYYEMTGQPGVLLGYLGEIRVQDEGGGFGCSITPAYSRVAFDTIQGSGSCTWGSDYNPRRLWIRNASVTAYEIWYFITDLPAGVTASRGQTVSITWQAKFGLGVVSATGWLSGAGVYPSGIIDQIINILLNNRGTLSLKAQRVVVKGRSGTNYDYTFIDTSPTLDPGTRRIILPLTPIPADGEVYRAYLYSRTTDGVDRELWIFELPTPLTVRKDDALGFEVKLVW